MSANSSISPNALAPEVQRRAPPGSVSNDALVSSPSKRGRRPLEGRRFSLEVSCETPSQSTGHSLNWRRP